MLVEILVFFCIEEAEEAAFDGFGADIAALVGVFHVDDEIANVVSGLHHVRQRMAGINKMLIVDFRDAALIHNFLKISDFRVENVVFFAVAFVEGRVGVF